MFAKRCASSNAGKRWSFVRASKNTVLSDIVVVIAIVYEGHQQYQVVSAFSIIVFLGRVASGVTSPAQSINQSIAIVYVVWHCCIVVSSPHVHGLSFRNIYMVEMFVLSACSRLSLYEHAGYVSVVLFLRMSMYCLRIYMVVLSLSALLRLFLGVCS